MVYGVLRDRSLITGRGMGLQNGSGEGLQNERGEGGASEVLPLQKKGGGERG